MSNLKKPFKELNNLELKEGIQSKFGSLARFCKHAKYDLYDLNKLLRLKATAENVAKLNLVYKTAKVLKNSIIEGEELNDQHRESLRKGIYAKYRNISEFCNKNPEFINNWISKLLHGDIRKITPKTKKLAKILNVEL